MDIKDLKYGVYKVKAVDEETNELIETLSLYRDDSWYFFGNSEGCSSKSIVEVGPKLDWETTTESYVIGAWHPRAAFIVSEVDGIEDFPDVKHTVKINKALREVTILSESGHFSYTDKTGNTEEFFGSHHVTFSPKQFKAYDRETGIVYAEWNDYES